MALGMRLLCCVVLASRSEAFVSTPLGVGVKPTFRCSCRGSSVMDSRIQLPRRYMAVEGDFDPEALTRAREEIQAGSVKARLRALYKFTRPHTIRGTVLASIAGTTRALIDTPGALANARWGTMLPRALVGMIALLLGNAFIVGINQIFDKDIDVLNKPFLPVASGEMSKRFAWVAVLLSACLGPLIVWNFFPPILFRLYSLGIVLGAIYSIPPIRTKRNPILAGLTIATVRGFLLNFGVYYAVKDAVGSTFSWSPKVSFIARFMTVFATIIAVTKDLPDVEGDKVTLHLCRSLEIRSPSPFKVSRRTVFQLRRHTKSKRLPPRSACPPLPRAPPCACWPITCTPLPRDFWPAREASAASP